MTVIEKAAAAVAEARAAFEDSVRLFPGTKVPVFGHDELDALLTAVRTHERAIVGAAAIYPHSFAHFFDMKAKWSEETFGPGDRYDRVVKHIRKELAEIEAKPDDLEEWVDVVLLAMDGAWRSAKADGRAFVTALDAKFKKNQERAWPDWRTLAPNQVAEHVRGPHETSKVQTLVTEEDTIWSLIAEFEEQQPLTGEDSGVNDRSLLFNLISQRFTPRTSR